jgi:hypothetical protein
MNQILCSRSLPKDFARIVMADTKSGRGAEIWTMGTPAVV